MEALFVWRTDRYADKFIDAELKTEKELTAAPFLEPSDLTEVGVEKLGHLRQIDRMLLALRGGKVEEEEVEVDEY